MPPPRSQVRFIARTLPGAATTSYPGFIAPMLAIARKKIPTGTKWLHELAFDGVRVQAHLVQGRATLYAPGGGDCTQRFISIGDAVKALPANHAVFDGVIVADPEGARSDRMVCYAFDLIFLDGFDIRAAPLIERKRVLEGLLAEAKQPRFAYSEHFAAGATVLRHARKIGARGIVSKDKDAPYRSGRSVDWILIT
jgi:bifunctional non-homologous end joining protein LigD